MSANAYDELTKAVSSLTDPNQYDIIAKYFKSTMIGNNQPTEYLRKARIDLSSLNQAFTQNDDLLRQLFIQSLPSQLQILLAVVPPSVPLDDLATIADRSYELIKQKQPVSTITANINTQNTELKLLKQTTKSLQDSISILTASINHLSVRSSRSTSRSHIRNRSLSNNTLICYYHQKFKNNAKSCQFGCRFFNSELFKPKICVYHGKYQRNARKCLDGCTWNTLNGVSTLN